MAKEKTFIVEAFQVVQGTPNQTPLPTADEILTLVEAGIDEVKSLLVPCLAVRDWDDFESKLLRSYLREALERLSASLRPSADPTTGNWMIQVGDLDLTTCKAMNVIQIATTKLMDSLDRDPSPDGNLMKGFGQAVNMLPLWSKEASPSDWGKVFGNISLTTLHRRIKRGIHVRVVTTKRWRILKKDLPPDTPKHLL